MQRIIRTLVAMVVALPSVLVAQFDATIIHEKYLGVDGPLFAEYFDMLNQKYQGTDATGWGIYYESPTVAYRLTAVPAESGMEGVVEVLNERVEGFQEFTEALPKDKPMTIAVMGCRVNGPGETDDADVGLWCGPKHVNMKRGGDEVGAFTYDEIIPKLKEEIDLFLSK